MTNKFYFYRSLLVLVGLIEILASFGISKSFNNTASFVAVILFLFFGIINFIIGLRYDKLFANFNLIEVYSYATIQFLILNIFA